MAALDFGTQAFDTETGRLIIGDDHHMVLGTIKVVVRTKI